MVLLIIFLQYCILIFSQPTEHFYATAIVIIIYYFMFFKFFFVAYELKSLYNKNLCHDFMIFLQSMQISQIQQDNVLFLPSAIINKITCFLRLLLRFDLYTILIFFVLCCTNDMLRAIILLFRSNFFQSLGPAGNSIPSQLYFLIQGFNFDILSGSFSIF